MEKITTGYYPFVEAIANTSLSIIDQLEKGWESGEVKEKPTVIDPESLYELCQAYLLLYSVAVEKQLINVPQKQTNNLH